MQIRHAAIDDLAEIVAIHNSSIAAAAIGYTEPFKEQERQGWLLSHTPTRPLVVAVSGQQIVGWANLGDYRPGRPMFQHTAELSYHVHPDHRRNGVASALIRYLLDRCPGWNIHTLIAIVLDSNEASAGLLLKLGFAHWGMLPAVAQIRQQTLGHLYFGYQVNSPSETD